jgi:hypothetical protein
VWFGTDREKTLALFTQRPIHRYLHPLHGEVHRPVRETTRRNISGMFGDGGTSTEQKPSPHLHPRRTPIRSVSGLKRVREQYCARRW